MASVGTWGGYTFEDNEINLVNVNRLAKYSARNKRMYHEIRMTCSGELIESSTANIVARIIEVENALKEDNRDFTYTVNGTLAHSLRNTSECVSGVKVVSYSFPKGDAAQLATTRHFTFTLQALYQSAEEDLVSWTETIEMIGNGGPIFFLVDTAFGPVALYVSQSSAINYIQSGQAVGYTAYPVPSGPIFTGLGAEFFNRRRIARTTPRKVGNAFRFYPIRWTYYYVQNPNGQTVIPVPQ